MKKLSSLFKKSKRLPSTSGVYLFKGSKDEMIYIGKAANLRKRVSSYFFKNNFRDRYGVLGKTIKDIDYIVTNSEMEALVLESNLIKEHQPRYNVQLKDDKRYPYLEITKEDFPRIAVTRSPHTNSIGVGVYGPYTDVKNLRRVVKMLCEVFCLRSCHYDLRKRRTSRPCLYYDLKRCSGPCRGYISREDYNKIVKQARFFLEGKNRLLQREMKQEMKKASLLQEYEKAAELRDRLRAIEKVWERQVVFFPQGVEGDFWALVDKEKDICLNLFKVREGRMVDRKLFFLKRGPFVSPAQALEEFLGQYYSTQDLVPSQIYTNIAVPSNSILKRYLTHKRGERVSISLPRRGEKKHLLELGIKNANLKLGEESLKDRSEKMIGHTMKEVKKLLNLPTLPYRVEGIDISHISGKEATGVITVFENGIPKPDEYRRFRIKFSLTLDDCAMISEIVERRYLRIFQREIIKPDLVLVDGGKGQVRSAVKKLKELGLGDIQVIGIAKRFEHIYTPQSKTPIAIPEKGLVLNFFKSVRDEAHRFSQKYHHLLRKKKIFL